MKSNELYVLKKNMGADGRRRKSSSERIMKFSFRGDAMRQLRCGQCGAVDSPTATQQPYRSPGCLGNQYDIEEHSLSRSNVTGELLLEARRADLWPCCPRPSRELRAAFKGGGNCRREGTLESGKLLRETTMANPRCFRGQSCFRGER